MKTKTKTIDMNGGGPRRGIEQLSSLLTLRVNETNEVRATVVRLTSGAIRFDLRQWFAPEAGADMLPGKGVMLPVTKEVMKALRDATRMAEAVVASTKGK